MAQPNTIAHWSFDEIVGGQFLDSSGNDYHATIATPDAIDGNELKLDTADTVFGGGAAFFDRGAEVSNQNSGTAGDGGPGAYAEAPHIAGIYTGSHTVAAWVKVYDETSWSGLVGDWANAPYTDTRAYLYGFTGGTDGSATAEKPMITLTSVGGNNGPLNFSGGTNAFTKDTWHHVAWIVDQTAADTSELSIYVDGTLFNSATWVDGDGNSDIRDNTANPTWIGLKEDNGIDLHARVDELWILDSALNSDQLNNLMNFNVVPEPTSLALLALGVGGLCVWRKCRNAL